MFKKFTVVYGGTVVTPENIFFHPALQCSQERKYPLNSSNSPKNHTCFWPNERHLDQDGSGQVTGHIINFDLGLCWVYANYRVSQNRFSRRNIMKIPTACFRQMYPNRLGMRRSGRGTGIMVTQQHGFVYFPLQLYVYAGGGKNHLGIFFRAKSCTKSGLSVYLNFLRTREKFLYISFGEYFAPVFQESQ